MAWLLSPRTCGIFVLLGVWWSSVCFGDSLTKEQQTRVAALRSVLARAEGCWENPNYPTTVTLTVESRRQKDLELLRQGVSGGHSERKTIGEPFGSGSWRFDEHGSGSLAWP